MKIVVAPDSFKGSSTSIEVADCIETGIQRVFPTAEVVKIPVADGGEGTVETMVLGSGGEYCESDVTGPLGERVRAKYGIVNASRAVIEMAAASGLPLVPQDKRNPMLTTTFGTGELITAALDRGCREFLIGIGGSATSDAGIGMAQALGYSFKDKDGNELGFGGGELEKLYAIEDSNADARLADCTIAVACDVTNPLFGQTGAAHVYGPQKGATPEMVASLDKNLRHFSSIVQNQMGKNVSDVPGAGAAGGLGAGLMLFCGAELKSGIEAMLDMVQFEKYLDKANLVITGEGSIDGSSTYGKVPVGVAQRAKKFDLPVLAVVGGIGAEAAKVYDFGIHAIMNILPSAMSLEEAMAGSSAFIEDSAERAMRIISIGQRLV